MNCPPQLRSIGGRLDIETITAPGGSPYVNSLLALVFGQHDAAVAAALCAAVVAARMMRGETMWGVSDPLLGRQT